LTLVTGHINFFVYVLQDKGERIAMPVLNLTYKQVEEIISQLNPEERLKLMKKIQRELWSKEMEESFKSLSKKIKKTGIKASEVNDIIGKVRAT
jgi:hypothetical protein